MHTNSVVLTITGNLTIYSVIKFLTESGNSLCGCGEVFNATECQCEDVLLAK